MEEGMKEHGRTTICTVQGFTHGQMEGNMKARLAIIKFLIGEYYLDKKHGKGVYTWADGRKYDGMWQNGKQHGEGQYVLTDGKVKIGMWKNGKRVGWLQESGENEVDEGNDQEDS